MKYQKELTNKLRTDTIYPITVLNAIRLTDEGEGFLTDLLNDKVDKDGAKVLSTNDYTTAEKTKLYGIQNNAEVNQNAFSTIKIAGQADVRAEHVTENLTFIAGSNVTLTTNPVNKTVSIAAAGNSGIYVGTDEPTDTDVNVWIDTDGTPDLTDIQVSELVSGSDTTLHKHDGRYYTETEVDTALANKANKLMATNIVTNGDFSNGTTGWLGNLGTISNVNNELNILANANTGGATQNNISLISGNKYYFSGMIKGQSSFTARLALDNQVPPYQNFGTIDFTLSTTFQLKSQIVTPSVTISTGAIRIRDMRSSGFDTFYADNILLINLTTLFGAGKEPTKAQMDWLLSQKFTNSWFNGTAELTSITDLFNNKADKTQTINSKALSSDITLNAIDIPNTPSGNISSTNVQNAINELDTEKAPTSHTHDGRYYTETEVDTALANKADKLFATNLVTNGDFSNGTTGWTLVTSTGAVANNIYTFTPTAIHGRIQQTSKNTQNGSKYYFAATVKATKSTVGLFAEQGFAYLETWHSGSGNFERLSNIYTGNATGVIGVIQIREFGTSNFAQVEVQNVMFINLTAVFGAGKEPTKKQMDRLLSIYPNSWFNGTQEITNIKQVFNEKADRLFATNIVTNGDFSNGTTGWSAYSSTISAASNTLSAIGNGVGVSVYARQLNILPANSKIFMLAYAKVTNSVCTAIRLRTGNGSIAKEILTPVMNQQYILSGIVSTSTATDLEITHTYVDASTANGKVMEVQKVLAINLTAMFGAGKEPTKEQMDWLLAQKFTNSWFNGTVELTSITDLLTLVNTKADKTQEAWITPTLLNGWTGLLQYYKDTLGTVHVRGNIRGGNDYTVICNLPTGYRPIATVTQIISGRVGDTVGGDYTIARQIWIQGTPNDRIFIPSVISWSNANSYLYLNFNYRAEA